MPEGVAGVPLFRRLVLIGVGLIGSSLARIAMERGDIAGEVVVSARTQRTLDRVMELGIAAEVLMSNPGSVMMGAFSGRLPSRAMLFHLDIQPSGPSLKSS